VIIKISLQSYTEESTHNEKTNSDRLTGRAINIVFNQPKACETCMNETRYKPEASVY
jgi:hypothetical protein